MRASFLEERRSPYRRHCHSKSWHLQARIIEIFSAFSVVNATDGYCPGATGDRYRSSSSLV
ncbi:MAG: hypothetical protein ACYTXA_25415 [Nostoc sp.]